MALGSGCSPADLHGAALGRKAGAALRSVPFTTVPSTKALDVPKTSAVQDGAYFTDLAKTDPALAPYVNEWGDVALRALLTDGSAFCAFLSRYGSVDVAMTSLAIGARGVEGQTHLPMSVRTFNAIDAVSLVDLCPRDVKVLPSRDRQRIAKLGAALHSTGS